VPDGVDADVNPVKPSRLQSEPDRSPSEAQPHELVMCDHAVLAGRQQRQLAVTWSTSCTYMGLEVDQVSHSAEGDTDRCTEPRANVTPGAPVRTNRRDGACRARTGDLRLAKAALFQLS
jgi:hypothetical protein